MSLSFRNFGFSSRNTNAAGVTPGNVGGQNRRQNSEADLDSSLWKAFRMAPIQDPPSKIVSLSAHQHKIVVSHADGSVHGLKADSDHVTIDTTIQQKIGKVDYVTFLSDDIILTLQSGTVRTYSYPTLSQIEELKMDGDVYLASSSFQSVVLPSDAVPNRSCFVAFAVKKKPLIIYILDKSSKRLRFRAQLPFNSSISFLQWFGDIQLPTPEETISTVHPEGSDVASQQSLSGQTDAHKKHANRSSHTQSHRAGADQDYLLDDSQLPESFEDSNDLMSGNDDYDYDAAASYNDTSRYSFAGSLGTPRSSRPFSFHPQQGIDIPNASESRNASSSRANTMLSGSPSPSVSFRTFGTPQDNYGDFSKDGPRHEYLSLEPSSHPLQLTATPSPPKRSSRFPDKQSSPDSPDESNSSPPTLLFAAKDNLCIVNVDSVEIQSITMPAPPPLLGVGHAQPSSQHPTHLHKKMFDIRGIFPYPFGLLLVIRGFHGYLFSRNGRTCDVMHNQNSIIQLLQKQSNFSGQPTTSMAATSPYNNHPELFTSPSPTSSPYLKGIQGVTPRSFSALTPLSYVSNSAGLGGWGAAPPSPLSTGTTGSPPLSLGGTGQTSSTHQMNILQSEYIVTEHEHITKFITFPSDASIFDTIPGASAHQAAAASHSGSGTFSLSPPTGFAYFHPFIVYATPTGLLVMNPYQPPFQRGNVLQFLPFKPPLHLVSSSLALYIASQTSLRLLTTISISTQLRTLLRGNKYDQAILLASLSLPLEWNRGISEKLWKIYQLQRLNAFQKFSAGHFDEAFIVFQSCQVNPEFVFRLFPFLLPSFYIPPPEVDHEFSECEKGGVAVTPVEYGQVSTLPALSSLIPYLHYLRELLLRQIDPKICERILADRKFAHMLASGDYYVDDHDTSSTHPQTHVVADGLQAEQQYEDLTLSQIIELQDQQLQQRNQANQEKNIAINVIEDYHHLERDQDEDEGQQDTHRETGEPSSPTTIVSGAADDKPSTPADQDHPRQPQHGRQSKAAALLKRQQQQRSNYDQFSMKPFTAYLTPKLLVLVDSILISAYIHTTPEPIVSFVSANCFADVQSTMRVLLSFQLYHEVIVLLKARSYHKEAINLLVLLIENDLVLSNHSVEYGHNSGANLGQQTTSNSLQLSMSPDGSSTFDPKECLVDYIHELFTSPSLHRATAADQNAEEKHSPQAYGMPDESLAIPTIVGTTVGMAHPTSSGEGLITIDPTLLSLMLNTVQFLIIHTLKKSGGQLTADSSTTSAILPSSTRHLRKGRAHQHDGNQHQRSSTTPQHANHQALHLLCRILMPYSDPSSTSTPFFTPALGGVVQRPINHKLNNSNIDMTSPHGKPRETTSQLNATSRYSFESPDDHHHGQPHRSRTYSNASSSSIDRHHSSNNNDNDDDNDALDHTLASSDRIQSPMSFQPVYLEPILYAPTTAIHIVNTLMQFCPGEWVIAYLEYILPRYFPYIITNTSFVESKPKPPSVNEHQVSDRFHFLPSKGSSLGESYNRSLSSYPTMNSLDTKPSSSSPAHSRVLSSPHPLSSYVIYITKDHSDYQSLQLLHTTLAELYITTYEEAVKATGIKNYHLLPLYLTTEYSPLRHRLVNLQDRMNQFLVASLLYDPEIVLQRLPGDFLLLERCEVLHRTGKITNVIHILVDMLQLDLAESYVERVYHETGDVAAFNEILTIYLTKGSQQQQQILQQQQLEQLAAAQQLQLQQQQSPETSEGPQQQQSKATSSRLQSSKIVRSATTTTNASVPVRVIGANNTNVGAVVNIPATTTTTAAGSAASSSQQQAGSDTQPSAQTSTSQPKKPMSSRLSIFIHHALKLIAKHPTLIDIRYALENIHPDVCLSDIVPVLSTLFQVTTQQQHHHQLLKGLVRRNHFMSKLHLSDASKQFYLIEPDTTCYTCQKKIGLSAFTVIQQSVMNQFDMVLVNQQSQGVGLQANVPWEGAGLNTSSLKFDEKNTVIGYQRLLHDPREPSGDVHNDHADVIFHYVCFNKKYGTISQTMLGSKADGVTSSGLAFQGDSTSMLPGLD